MSALYLQQAYPDEALAWHSTKNGHLKPEDVTISSHKKVWWQCVHATTHIWEEAVKEYLRPKKGGKCPYCDNRRVLAGDNDLATTNPDLAKQWHPTKNADLSPSEITARSSRSVAWLGNCGHEWAAPVSARTLKGRGCPYCAGRLVLPGFNDLATTDPGLVDQWHPNKNVVSPREVSRGSTQSVWWICSVDPTHEWKATPNSRTNNGTGCSVCSGHQISVGINDLLSTHPEIAARWHPIKNTKPPTEVTAGSRYVAWWQCAQGHEWSVECSRVSQGGWNCPYCAGWRITAGVNDLATLFPKVAQQWHPTKNGTLTPEQVSRGSDRVVWWQCEKGHEWQNSVKNRTLLLQGCGRCQASLQSSHGERDLVLMLKELTGSEQVETSVRNLIPGELDIYLPDQKFAVEYNGVYWHSEAAGKTRRYHQTKQQACEDLGITLYQVWEDDWRDRREIVLRGLAHRLGVTHQLNRILPELPEYYTQTIGARQTKVVILNSIEAAFFLTQHHIQGSATGTHYLGLVDREERLRAVLVLKRTGKTGELSIERYATAGTVSGGFSKLLKHAEKTFKPTRWVTFADLSISDGGLYEKTGFTVERVLRPDYSYLVRGRRVHKFNYRLARFKSDPNLQYQEGLSERELAALNGLHRIWDSGKVRYVKECLFPSP